MSRELLDRWRALPDPETLTIVEAARRLGVTDACLRTTLSRARRAGEDIPARRPGPRTDERDYILEEWEMLRDCGASWQYAARALGLSEYRFGRILSDAAHRGDPRGIYLDHHHLDRTEP